MWRFLTRPAPLPVLDPGGLRLMDTVPTAPATPATRPGLGHRLAPRRRLVGHTTARPLARPLAGLGRDPWAGLAGPRPLVGRYGGVTPAGWRPARPCRPLWAPLFCPGGDTAAFEEKRGVRRVPTLAILAPVVGLMSLYSLANTSFYRRTGTTSGNRARARST